MNEKVKESLKRLKQETWTCKEMCVSLCHDSCVSQEDLDTYLGKVKGYPQGYAWVDVE